MAYGTIKVDQVTFTNGGIDQTISVSGIVQSISGDITATGTIQGATIIGTSTVSGATVTGDAGQFITATAATGVFASTLSGATITGNTASFTTITGGTVTLTSGVFASGTAAAPSVSIGTTDNGLYSPGADQLAISTNGTGRLFVDASGNVGVGVASPVSALNVSIADGGNVTISNTNDGHTGGLAFGDTSSNDSGRISYDHFSNTMRFDTAGDERLRITSDGKLGLGTSSPGSLLTSYPGNVSTLGAKASTGILVDNNGTAGNVSQIGLGYTFSSTYHPVAIAAITDSGSGSTRADLHFATRSLTTDSAPDTRMIIKNDGKVGIGTTPAYTLDVAGNVQFGSSSNSVGLSRFIGSNYHQIYSDGTFYFDAGTSKEIIFRNNGGSNEAFRVDSSRRLLVGTPTALTNVLIKGDLVSSAATTPQQQFALAANNYNAGLSVTNYSASGYGGVISLNSSKSNTLGTNTLVDNTIAVGTISFNGNDGTNFVPCAEIKAAVDGTPGSNDMPGRLVFATTADGASNPTERMRIKSTGIINFANVPTYADNTAALAGGLVAGDVYRKSDGTLMITY